MDHFLELSEGDGIDVQFPLEVLAHLSLHLVEHPLSDNRPRDSLECVSSQMTFEARMKADMNNR